MGRSMLRPCKETFRSLLRSKVLTETVEEPEADGEHTDVAKDAHSATDFLVLAEETPLGEQNRPIAFFRADQGQRGGAGIGHVRADIREIFEEPEDAEGEAGGLALPEEIDGAEKRDEEFAESSAKNHDGIAKPTEEEMTAFVNDKVNVVEEEEAGAAG